MNSNNFLKLFQECLESGNIQIKTYVDETDDFSTVTEVSVSTEHGTETYKFESNEED